MKKLFFLMFFVFFVYLLFGETDIYGGNVSGRWMLRNSPYIVHDNINIHSGDSLYIDQGVQVIFMGNYYFHIQGAIFADGSHSNHVVFTVNDTTGFSDTSNLEGSWGGIYIDNASGTVKFNYTDFSYAKDLATNGRATNNAGKGGAVCIENTTVTFDHCKFEHNYSIYNGGAIAFVNSTDLSYILKCVFSNNKTDDKGGAVSAENSNLKILISKFHDNFALSYSGGAFFAGNSNITFSSNLFYYNQANLGGALFFDNSSIHFYNNTVSDNTANTSGGGILQNTSDVIDFYNNILYYNVPDQVYFQTANSTEFKYSDIQDGDATDFWFGEGCISDVPQFQSRPINYQLSESSPCINRGYPDSNNLDIYQFDLNEFDRFYNGIIDMGAYERNDGTIIGNIVVDFHADVTEGYQPLGVQFYDDSTEAADWYWDFGDGTTSTEKNPFHTYDSPGNYTVSLTASGMYGSDTQTKVNYITVKQATHINTSTVSGFWTRENSPYIVDNDIEIEQTQTLTIEPGVSVLFSGNYTFSVYGNLQAVGTEQDSIYFSVVDTTGYSQNQHTGWGGIKFYQLAYLATETSQLSYCIIEYGKVNGEGGGIYLYEVADYFAMEHSVIRYCKAENGGAIAISGGSFPQFDYVFFIKNTATQRGGAILVNQGAQPEFLHCKISKNRASTGAAIHTDSDSEIMIEHSLISKNIVTNGGIITLDGVTNNYFTNITVSGNRYQTDGYALVIKNDAQLRIKNSIFWNYLLTQEIQIINNGSVLVNYSDIRGGWDNGTFIYNIEPNYRNTISYKLALLNSDQTDMNPLIDAGDPADDYSQEPMPNGGRINLGAYGGTSEATYSCSVQNNNVDGDEQWGNNLIHVLIRDIVVEPSATLMIQPGSVIQATNGHKLHILGNLIANATRGDTIIFTNNYNDTGSDDPWYGIVFEGQSQHNSSLNNVLIENAQHGITIQNKGVLLSNFNLRYSLSQNSDKALSFYGSSEFNLHNSQIVGYPIGIYFSNTNNRDVATPSITNTRIRNSSSSSRDDDIGIQIEGNVSATVDSCIIEGYTTGISQSGEAGQTASPTITNTRIRNSSSSSKTLQTAIMLQDIATPQIDNNTIEGYETAIKVITTRRDNSSPTITNSRLRNNPSSSRTNTTNGIYFEGNVTAQVQNNIIDDFDIGIKYQGNGQSFRDTPLLSNNRIRNSSSSSRDSLLTTGLEINNIINIDVQSDSIVGYQIGIDINNSSRTTSTPTITNTRIRNSSSSSRDETYGIKLNGNIAGLYSNLRIVDYDYGFFYEGSGEATRDTPTLSNTRIRNSSSSSRASGNIAIYYHNVITSLIDSCMIDEYPVSIKMVNETRTTATPVLSNTRIRTSPSSSRDIVKGIVLEGDFTGDISYNEIVNQDSAIVLRYTSPNLTIKENVIYFDVMENDDEQAVAIYACQTGNLDIRNNTIYLYDYAFLSVESPASIINMIAYKENPIYEPVTSGANITVEYSDIAKPNGAIYPGTGNINENPLFFAPHQGNFRLKTGSPCIDNGSPNYLDPDGSRSDMGRYYQPKLYDFDAQSMFGALPSHNVQFTESSTGFNENNSTWYWDFENDGVYDMQTRNPIYNFTQPGLYTVKLKIVKFATQDSLVKEKFIVIQNQELPAPQNVQLSVTGDDIHLSWDPITWPSKNRGRYYLIYKSNRPNGDFEYLDYTNNTAEYTDINGASQSKAFYKIIAYEGTMRELQLLIERSRKLQKQKDRTRR